MIDPQDIVLETRRERVVALVVSLAVFLACAAFAVVVEP